MQRGSRSTSCRCDRGRSRNTQEHTPADLNDVFCFDLDSNLQTISMDLHLPKGRTTQSYPYVIRDGIAADGSAQRLGVRVSEVS